MFVLFLVCLLLIVAILVWRRFHYLSQLHKTGLPGPKPHLIFGNFLQFRHSAKPCHLVIDDWLKEYGDTFGFHMGIQRYVVVKDLNILKQIFITNFREFHCRPPPSITTEEFSTSLLQTLEYDRWKSVRSLMIACFSVSKMKTMWPLLTGCVDKMVAIIDQAVLSRANPVEVQALFQALACDIIATCALALNTNCQSDQNDPFLHRVRHFMENASNFVTESALCFPMVGSAIHLLIKKFKLTEQMVAMIFDNLSQVIQQRRQLSNGQYRDILQTLLDHGTRDSSAGDCSAGRHTLSDLEIKSNVLVLLLAGYETTANHLVFTCHLLARHRHIQQRLFDEIAANCGLDNEPNYEQICSLLYLDNVLSESLRLYPPVVTFMARHSAGPIELDGRQLPAGVNIMAPVWSLHHDPSLWPEPDQFLPDRFGNEDGGHQAPSAANSSSTTDPVWIPFGLGPRSCLGRRFAQLETKLALVKIIRRYAMVLTAQGQRELKVKVPTVTLCADEPVLITFVPRSQ